MSKKLRFPLEKNSILKVEEYFYKFLNSISNTIPISEQFEELDEAKDFFSNEDVISVKDEGCYWKLGFSDSIITPKNILSQKYYVGGNISIPPRRIEYIIDNIKVRTIALSTNNSNIIVLAVVDCIGLTNFYVNKIRNDLQKFCERKSVKVINVFSTHTHSSVDTMGIWSVGAKGILSSYIKSRKGLIPEPTVDQHFMDLVVEKTKETIIEAVNNMHLGKLFFLEVGSNSSKKIDEEIKNRIGFNSAEDYWDEKWQKLWDEEFSRTNITETGIYEYILSKRSPYEFSPRITRIRFKPLNNNVPETVIINLSAHPYSNGLKLRGEGSGDMLSGDFVYYMEEIFNQNKYNMIFLNGAINGVYPKRKAIINKEKKQKYKLTEQTKIIGNEFASILLAVCMTSQEIYSDKTTNPQGKSLAYQSVINHKKALLLKEIEIKPVLKSYNKGIFLKCTNPLEQIIGKLNFAQFNLYKTREKDIYVKSEIGYIQLGEYVNIALVPGEITNTLCSDNVIYERKTRTVGRDIASIDKIFGDKTLVFGLANDSIGYIIHPDDYYFLYVGNGLFSRKLFGENFTHYQEIFSLGENVACELLSEFEEIKKIQSKE